MRVFDLGEDAVVGTVKGVVQVENPAFHMSEIWPEIGLRIRPGSVICRDVYALHGRRTWLGRWLRASTVNECPPCLFSRC
jgi:hypothetical protein